MAHPHEIVVRTFLEGFPRGDMEAVANSLADDVVWHWAGRSRISGDYVGKDAVMGFFESFGREFRGEGIEHDVTLHDIVAGDDHTVVIWTRTARRPGKELNSNGVGVYHVRNGKITEVWVIHVDQYAADEFFS